MQSSGWARQLQSTVSKNMNDLLITLFGDLESLLAAKYNSLKHLVGGDMGLEISRVPELSHQLSETLDQQEHDIPWRTLYVLIIVFFQEVVPKRRNIRQSLESNTLINPKSLCKAPESQALPTKVLLTELCLRKP